MSHFEFIMPFGKYKGHSLGQIKRQDRGYLLWMSEKLEDVKIKESVKHVLTSDQEEEGIFFGDQIVVNNGTKGNVFKLNSEYVAVTFPYDAQFVVSFKGAIDGAAWDKKNRHWKVPAVKLPALIDFFGKKNLKGDDETKAMYKKEITRKEDLDIIRQKQDTDIDVSGLKLPLFGYQKSALEFCIRGGGRILIADEMGLGKTLAGIAYALHTKSKTLVICPKSVIMTWVKQIEKFTDKSVCIWETDKKIGHANATFHITNYDTLAKNIEKLREAGFELLICDEATYLKNRKTKRTKFIMGDWKHRKLYPEFKTKYVLFLTGTPILNRPIEAFTLLNFLDSNRFNNFYNFVERYGGWQGEPSKNLDELHERTKELIIRRRKVDVMPDLPEKIRTDIYVELAKPEIKEYNELLTRLFGSWTASGKPSVVDMHELTAFLSDIKIPRTIEVIDELLESDRSVLIFSTRLDQLYTLQKHYGNIAVVLDGQMSTKKRQASVDALINKTAKIGLFSLGAGSMGIDGLQHSIDTAIFLNEGWTPAIHDQAEARIFRIGTTSKVQIYYMLCQDTTDEYMRELLAEKQDVIDRAIDGGIMSDVRGKSFFKEFVKKIKFIYNKDLDEDNIVDTE